MTPADLKGLAHCPDCDTVWLNPGCDIIYCGCVERKRLVEAGEDPMQCPRTLRAGRVWTPEELKAAGLGLAIPTEVITPARVEL